MTENDTELTIGEASEKTGLPESTIRFYDREFSDYLSIQRGENNQRLFTDENLTDLEYIRFLIKRENLSIDQVGERLSREEDFKNRNKNSSPDQPEERPEETQTIADSEMRRLQERLDEIEKSMNHYEEKISQIQEDQETILKLLDMNLQRYNEVVKQLPIEENP